MKHRLRSAVKKLVTAPEPPGQQGPYLSEREASEVRQRLNVRWSGHLNACEGYFEVDQREDGYWVVERRGRQSPKKKWLTNLLTFTPNS